MRILRRPSNTARPGRPRADRSVGAVTATAASTWRTVPPTAATARPDLASAALDGLRDLIEFNVLSARGLVRASRVVRTPRTRTLLANLAKLRRQFATELEMYVVVRSAVPRCDAGGRAELSAAWADVRTALDGGDVPRAARALCGAERSLVERYEQVLGSVENVTLRDVVARQLRSARRTVRLLRTATRG